MEISKKEQEEQNREAKEGEVSAGPRRLRRTLTSPEDIHPPGRKAFKEMLAWISTVRADLSRAQLPLNNYENSSSVLVYKRKKGIYLLPPPWGCLRFNTGTMVCDSDSKKCACDAGDPGSIPGLGGSPGEGQGNPLQNSCLENSTERGAWWATVHGLSKSWTLLSE